MMEVDLMEWNQKLEQLQSRTPRNKKLEQTMIDLIVGIKFEIKQNQTTHIGHE